MPISVTNTSNVGDGGTRNLGGAYALTTATAGGNNYVIVGGYTDNGISVLSLQNGVLTPVFDLADSGATHLARSLAAGSAVVGGVTYVYISGGEDGLSAFRLNNDGSLTLVADIADTAGSALTNNYFGFTTAVVAGTTYLYASSTGESGITEFRVDVGGALTQIGVIRDSANPAYKLGGVAGMETVTVGATQFLIASGQIDNAVNVLQVNNDGTLSFVSAFVDTGATAIAGTFNVTTAQAGGVTYVYATGYGDSGVSVFTLSAAGQLTNVQNIFDSASTLLARAITADVITADGQQYLAVGGQENGVTLFQIGADGLLTLDQVINDTASTYLSGAAHVTGISANGGYLITAGFSDNGVSAFRLGAIVASPNQAPTIGNLQGDSVTFTEGGANQFYIDVGRNATVTDTDSANFNGGSLTVAITGGLVASRDRLAVVQEGNITLSGQSAGSTVSVNGFVIGTLGQFNLGTNTQTITFTTDDATAARVQLLIHAINYVGDPQDPVSGTRTVTWTLVDGDGTANGGADTVAVTSSIVITGVNDAPTFANLNGDNVTGIANSSTFYRLDSGGNATVADVDSANFDTGTLTVSITNPLAGDSLTTVQAGGITGTGATVSFNGVEFASYTGYGTETLVFTFDPDATPAAVQALIHQLGLQSSTATAGTRNISFTLTDGDGVANGGMDTATAATTVTLTAPNAPPAGADATLTAIEDMPRALAVADFGFSDTDGNMLQAVRITTLPTAGALTLNGAAVTAGAFVAASEIAAGHLVFTPGEAGAGTGNGYATLTFQVQDDGGTAGGGQNTDQSPNTLTFNVTPVNDAPTIANLDGDVIHQIEDQFNQPFVDVGQDAVITDPDSGNFDGGQLIVAVTSGFDGDIVTVGRSGNVGLDYDTGEVSVGGVIIGIASGGDLVFPYRSNFTIDLNGNATAALVQTLLHQIAAYDPRYEIHGGTREIQVTLSDGDGGASSYHTQLVVTAINDEPFGTDGTISAPGNAPYVIQTGDFGFDPGGFTNQYFHVQEDNQLQAVIITTLPTAGTLTLNGAAVAAGDTVSASDIAAGLLVFTPATGGTGNGYASFTFQVQDNGGTADGGVDTDQSPNTLTFNVVAVNDAPAGADRTLTAIEDTPVTLTTGKFGFSDGDGNTLQAVEITTLPAAGTLTLNGIAVTAGTFVAASEIAAGHLVYTPGANDTGNGYASFTFQVQDDGGTANGGVDTDQSPNTLTFNVVAVNDAPAGADRTLTAIEDTPVTLTTGKFGFSDGDGNTLQAVEITTLPAAGTLTLNGIAVTAGTFVAASEIAAGHLVYTPGANGNGNGYASFTFQVQDNGGTANGGVDTDQSPNTLTFNVVAVNDAPAGADRTLTAIEDTPVTLTTGKFGFSDGDGNTLQAVEITTLPAAGTLTLNGIAVTAGTFVAANEIAAGHLVYTPGANGNGNGYASFTFQVQDNGGTANGGVDTDQSPNTLTFNVVAVNDAPAGADRTLTAIEDTPVTLTTGKFGFSDGDGNTLQAVEITTLPAAGTLTLNGIAVTAGTFVAANEIAAGHLVYTPGTNGTASFTFQVQDNGGTANGGVDTDQSPNTLTFNVTGSNSTAAMGGKMTGPGEDGGLGLHGGDKLIGITGNDGPAYRVSSDIDAKHVGVLVHFADKIALPGIDTIGDDRGAFHFIDDAGFTDAPGLLHFDPAGSTGTVDMSDNGVADLAAYHLWPLHQMIAGNDYPI